MFFKHIEQFATPLIRRDVPECLSEGPLMAEGILGVVLPLSEGEIGWLGQDATAMVACSFAMGVNVLNSYHHHVRVLARTGMLAGDRHGCRR